MKSVDGSHDSRRTRKVADITQALSASPVDVAALRRMAISEGGLLTDEIRCQGLRKSKWKASQRPKTFESADKDFDPAEDEAKRRRTSWQKSRKRHVVTGASCPRV
ncbi:hypothetical protein CRUP_023846 [Coryphaenoides rupestris]|nr:hypothetical protein CRUP_023846 [Coryphaenoides rupestris]